MWAKAKKETKRADSEKMSPLLPGLAAVCLALLAVIFFIDAAPQDGCIQFSFFGPVVGNCLGMTSALLALSATVLCVRSLRTSKQQADIRTFKYLLSGKKSDR